MASLLDIFSSVGCRLLEIQSAHDVANTNERNKLKSNFFMSNNSCLQKRVSHYFCRTKVCKIDELYSIRLQKTFNNELFLTC